MKTFTYQEQNATKSLVLIVVYFTVWIAGAIIYFGGIGDLADAVNNIGSAKMTGFLVAALVLVPFFFIMKLIYTKVEIQINSQHLEINKKGEIKKIIPFTDIYTIKVNQNKLNTLHIYGKNVELLWEIRPIISESNMVDEVAAGIAENIPFQKSSETKKFLNTQYLAVTYKR